MSYFKISLKTGREIVVVAQNKTHASVVAIQKNLLTRDDSWDIVETVELTETEYNIAIGRQRVDPNIVPIVSVNPRKKEVEELI